LKKFEEAANNLKALADQVKANPKRGKALG